MKKIVSSVLIIIGILFLLTPFAINIAVKHYSNLVMQRNNSESILETNMSINNKFNSNNQDYQTKFEYDINAVEDINIKSVIKASLNFNANLMIGTILIPNLDINLPIMEGLSNANLLAGAATIKPNQSFGSGNYTLAGHYMNKKELPFGNLMNKR